MAGAAGLAISNDMDKIAFYSMYSQPRPFPHVVHNDLAQKQLFTQVRLVEVAQI